MKESQPLSTVFNAAREIAQKRAAIVTEMAKFLDEGDTQGVICCAEKLCNRKLSTVSESNRSEAQIFGLVN